MSLIKRDPLRELELWNKDFPAMRGLERLQHEVNRLFDEWFNDDRFNRNSSLTDAWSPAVDIIEEGDTYVLKAELPGSTKEDVKITLNDNLLIIRGEKKNEAEKKGSNYYRIERSYGSFERSFVLPGGVKNDKIDASFDNGVLTVRLPKTDESKTKAIDIKVK